MAQAELRLRAREELGAGAEVARLSDIEKQIRTLTIRSPQGVKATSAGSAPNLVEKAAVIALKDKLHQWPDLSNKDHLKLFNAECARINATDRRLLVIGAQLGNVLPRFRNAAWQLRAQQFVGQQTNFLSGIQADALRYDKILRAEPAAGRGVAAVVVPRPGDKRDRVKADTKVDEAAPLTAAERLELREVHKAGVDKKKAGDPNFKNFPEEYSVYESAVKSRVGVTGVRKLLQDYKDREGEFRTLGVIYIPNLGNAALNRKAAGILNEIEETRLSHKKRLEEKLSEIDVKGKTLGVTRAKALLEEANNLPASNTTRAKKITDARTALTASEKALENAKTREANAYGVYHFYFSPVRHPLLAFNNQLKQVFRQATAKVDSWERSATSLNFTTYEENRTDARKPNFLYNYQLKQAVQKLSDSRRGLGLSNAQVDAALSTADGKGLVGQAKLEEAIKLAPSDPRGATLIGQRGHDEQGARAKILEALIKEKKITKESTPEQIRVAVLAKITPVPALETTAGLNRSKFEEGREQKFLVSTKLRDSIRRMEEAGYTKQQIEGALKHSDYSTRLVGEGAYQLAAARQVAGLAPAANFYAKTALEQQDKRAARLDALMRSGGITTDSSAAVIQAKATASENAGRIATVTVNGGAVRYRVRDERDDQAEQAARTRSLPTRGRYHYSQRPDQIMTEMKDLRDSRRDRLSREEMDRRAIKDAEPQSLLAKNGGSGVKYIAKAVFKHTDNGTNYIERTVVPWIGQHKGGYGARADLARRGAVPQSDIDESRRHARQLGDEFKAAKAKAGREHDSAGSDYLREIQAVRREAALRTKKELVGTDPTKWGVELNAEEKSRLDRANRAYSNKDESIAKGYIEEVNAAIKKKGYTGASITLKDLAGPPYCQGLRNRK